LRRMRVSQRRQRRVHVLFAALGLTLASLAAVGTAPALATSLPASFIVSGALHGTATARCFVNSYQGVHSLDFTADGLTVAINEYKSAGAVNFAKTHTDFVSVDELGGRKNRMWVAGWTGASDSGVPFSVGSDLGSGTLQVSSPNLAIGSINVHMVPATKALMPANFAKGTVHMIARWSGCRVV
jgi:hypothetical protein